MHISEKLAELPIILEWSYTPSLEARELLSVSAQTSSFNVSTKETIDIEVTVSKNNSLEHLCRNVVLTADVQVKRRWVPRGGDPTAALERTQNILTNFVHGTQCTSQSHPTHIQREETRREREPSGKTRGDLYLNRGVQSHGINPRSPENLSEESMGKD
ncbi:hypothetical protein EVAR_68269_1 [Eumeta japonica]|uniref:Uncharacterized protein n=1 Tax=Eumeta variegata TaxID=151549 RepID=A0A4C1SSQ4_EUMVA|nr:hypothetical protein EVAR_68269_1 [Eumeta japonica]